LRAPRNRLWSLTYETGEGLAVVLQPAGSLGYARLTVERGRDWAFQEACPIDAKTAKTIPQSAIGNPLALKQAEALLKKIG